MATKEMFEELEYYKNYQLDEGEIDLRFYLLNVEHLEEKIRSGEYPTPAVLSARQREKGQPPRDPSATNEPPFPPRRRKEEIFDAAAYTEKDAYVRSLLPEPAETEESFAARLFQHCSSNLDKVRAAFVFVSSAKVDQLTEAESASELYRLAQKLRTVNSFVDLFEKLLKLGQVPYKRIEGYKKVDRVGYEPINRDFWFACYVEGEWRFVDPRRGSVGIFGFSRGDFQEISNDGSVKDAEKSEGKTVYDTREFFFLTDPDKLIQTHCPREAFHIDWQLLVRPLSVTEFKRIPRFFIGSTESICEFINKLKPLSHPWEVIAAAPGTTKIDFLKEDDNILISSSVAIHKKDVNEKSKTAIKKEFERKGNECLSKQINKKNGRTRIRFKPPCAGKFKFNVHLQRSGSSPRPLLYVSYVIHCPKAAKKNQRLPQGKSELPYFGPGEEMENAGLNTSEEGEIYASNGEHLLTITRIDQRRQVPRCELMSATNEQLPTRNVLVWTVDSNIFILFLSPDSGSYALVMYNGAVPVCQFLVDAPSEFRDASEFPPPNFNELGGLGFFNSDLSHAVQPESHSDPHILCEESTLNLSFRISEIQAEIQAELLHIVSGGRGEVSQGYALVSSPSREQSNVSMRFPIAGHYVVRVNGRRNRSESWRPFSNYFIRAVGELNSEAEQFPQAMEAWSSRDQVLLPRQSVLPVEETVHFALRMSNPNVNSVSLIVNESKDTRIELKKHENGMWKGSVKALQSASGQSARVVSSESSGSSNVCGNLLNYRFESAEDTKIRNSNRKSASELNKRRKISERRQKRKQENFELDEMAMDLLPEDPGEETGNQNPDKTAQREQTMRYCFRTLSGPDYIIASADQHRSVQAALLLLNHCEQETQDWSRCRAVMRCILREQIHPDVDRIHPKIAEKSLSILDSLQELRYKETLQRPAETNLRKWARVLAKEVLAKDPNEKHPAASRADQVRIMEVDSEIIEAWK